MNKDWLKLYFEFNTDLQQTEYILVGEKNGEQYKYAYAQKNLSKIDLEFVTWLNNSIEDYLKLKANIEAIEVK